MRFASNGLTRRAERTLGKAANLIWPLVERYGERFANEPFRPKWAPAPLQRKQQRTFPPLGWPRRTDSLVPELREGGPQRRALRTDRPRASS